jgi:polar amino acid transport system substrate-binding protein
MKTLIIGADPFPPYQYIDEDGNIKGSDYDIVNNVVKKLKLKAEYIIDEWSIIERKLNQNEIDAAFQVQKTPEREKIYFFSNKLRDATTSIIAAKNDTQSNNLEELLEDGSKLAVINNYKYGDVIDNISQDKKITFLDLEKLIKAVDNEEVEYGVVDLGVYNYINKDETYENVKLVDGLDFNRPLFVVFNDQELRDKFNQYL